MALVFSRELGWSVGSNGILDSIEGNLVDIHLLQV